jgi:catechol-2,3-dioxygenase
MNTVQVAASVARLELTAFHHVALTVRDLDASAAWYTDVLGLSEVFREQRDGRKAAIMRFPAGGYCVALVEHTGTGADRFDPTRPGLDHLAFTVGSRNDLVHWAARLAEAAVTHTGPTDIATGAIVNLKDPDGTALAFFWDRP